jgi:arylsulfatase A
MSFHAALGSVPSARIGLIIFAVLAFFEPLRLPRCVADERGDRPNIVLIMADDLGYGELGSYGQQKIETPRLDELAREGLRFTQFYSGSPVCAPARCVLMTGKHSGHAAIRDNRNPRGLNKLRERHEWEFPGQIPLPDAEITIAELLKARGYATAAIGKWGLGHVGTSGDPANQGIDLFYGYLCQVHAHNHYPRFLWRNHTKEPLPGNTAGPTGDTHSQDKFTEEALRFIRAHRDEPFFLYLPLIIPHLAIQVPESSLEQYAGKFAEEPHEHGGHYERHPTPRAGYAAMISHMDRGIGEIVDLIDELGLSENTLILFLSDNGPTFRRLGGADSDFFNSAGPLRGRKGSVYEGGIRVPFIAHWQGKISGGRAAEHVAAHWDLLPTLSEIAGAEAPEKIDGISFAQTLFQEEGQRQHEYLYWEFPAYGFQQAVRAGDWKAVRHNLNKGDSEFELYDLHRDIGEERDVAADYPEIVRRMEQIADSAHTPSEKFPLFQDEMQRQEPRRAGSSRKKSAG